jgi:hypothetical protein
MTEGKLCRVLCEKEFQSTQLGPTLLQEAEWRWPEISRGDIVTVIGPHEASRHIKIDQFVVLAQVNEHPVVGWLYHYELEEVNLTDQEDQGGDT